MFGAVIADPDQVVPRWKGRDAGILIAASVALLVSLGAVAALVDPLPAGIARPAAREPRASRRRPRHSSSAPISTQQERRQMRSGELLLSGPSPPPRRFAAISSAFGANVAVLLNSNGDALTEAPYSHAITGRDIGFESLAGREAIKGHTNGLGRAAGGGPQTPHRGGARAVSLRPSDGASSRRPIPWPAGNCRHSSTVRAPSRATRST